MSGRLRARAVAFPGSARSVHTGTLGDLISIGQSKFVLVNNSKAGYYWYYVTYSNGATGWGRGDLINIWPKGCIIACPEN